MLHMGALKLDRSIPFYSHLSADKLDLSADLSGQQHWILILLDRLLKFT